MTLSQRLCLTCCLVGTIFPLAALGESELSLASPTPAPVVINVPREEIYEERFAVKGQATYIGQTKPSFAARYTVPGFNSLSPQKEQSHTATATAYVGAHLWRGGEAYVNGEMVIGVPFSDLHGLAAVPNSEIQKASGPNPLFYMPRAFLRQTWALSSDYAQMESGINQLAGRTSSRRLVLSLGKLSVMDIFDGNTYAHDGRRDFFSWVNVAGGAYDYAADVRGYSIGAALEYYHDNWAFRAGRFMVPRESNGLQLNFSIGNFHGDQLEIEHSYHLITLPGKVRAVVFRNVEFMGRFDEAITYAAQHGGTPDVANVRRSNRKHGYVLGIEQKVNNDFAIFGRASWNNGQTEMFSYTEVERSTQIGASLTGNQWNRAQDTVGLALTVNGLSNAHREYLSRGGTGFLIGDGRLSYREEKLAEVYYSFACAKSIWFTVNWQHVVNPAYNSDRGPVDIFGLRAHAEF